MQITTNRLINVKKFFDSFSNSFFADDSYVNTNLQLKVDHTWRVCDEMQYIVSHQKNSANEPMTPTQKEIAFCIALLHDVGRFPQFAKYKTYHDRKSVPHAQLSLTAINDNNVLAGFSPTEQHLITTAIAHHSDRDLPANLDKNELLYSQLIRDADKIDIYHVLQGWYDSYAKDPDKFAYEKMFPETDTYSPEILKLLMTASTVDYTLLKNCNDLRLLQLSWVFDINTPAALQRILKRQYLERIFSYLPENKEINQLRDFIFDYAHKRITNS